MDKADPACRVRRAGILFVALLVMAFARTDEAIAQDTRPYDDRLMRLTEILGAVHYMRELCGANEGQLWRDRMRELMETEGSSALRRARLTRSFNKGYYGYSRTYKTCTSSAQTAISRFMAEATQIADGLVRTVP